ncbi:MAG TPA: FHA domain-containing protein [Nocardioides sp.]
MATPALRISANLDFTMDLPDGSAAHGRLRGSGQRLTLDVDRPEVFAAPGDASTLIGIAEVMGRRGMRVDVVHAGTALLSLGDVRAPWWHRRLTGSRRIRLGGLRSLVAPGRARLGRRSPQGVLPDRGLVPPPTLLPIAPTFQRHPRRVVTTTHDPARGGQPRLVLVASEAGAVSSRVIWLRDDVTTIGSSAGCDLQIAGVAPVHVEVVHDDQDEFVVQARVPGVRVNGAPVTSQLLRTGARLQVGNVTLVFQREEFADHGRPYGGRIGGELGHQVPQPPRSVLQGRHDE